MQRCSKSSVEIYVPNSTLPGRVRYLSPFVSLMGVEGRHDPDKPGWIVDGFSADYIVSGAYNGIKITAQVAFKENCRIMSLGYQVLVFCVD